MEKTTCFITQESINIDDAYQGEFIRKAIFDLIKKDYPLFTKQDAVSIESLNIYRKKYLSKILKQETGELNKMEKEVLTAISENKILSENLEPDFEEEMTTGQKVADLIAVFGGSWTFIIGFFTFILFWIGINILWFANKSFDPYPFILLNLVLSCLAAIQAPIIMMSQNRQEQKDRSRSEHDYKINLKAELEIRMMQEKIDHLVVHQNRRMLQIQELQTDYLEDILKQIKTIHS